jgi:hypothetical protein
MRNGPIQKFGDLIPLEKWSLPGCKSQIATVTSGLSVWLKFPEDFSGPCKGFFLFGKTEAQDVIIGLVAVEHGNRN